MQRFPKTDGLVYFTPDEVIEMLRERLRAEGVEQEILGVQIGVYQPFEADSRCHYEVPTLTIILSNAGQ